MMTRHKMNPTAKSTLSKTIRTLRTRLSADFEHALEARYRLSKPAHQAGLDEERRAARERIEEWLGERVRGEADKKKKQRRGRQDFIAEVVREAAYTLINRLVLLRLMEEADLVKPAVLSGGWQSPGYREWCEWAPALLDDATDGYATLLGLVFDELAHDLPGLYGEVGLTGLVPVPPQTLRAAVEALDADALDGCWSDDTTLGWVYQYFNDPDREALDKKLNARGKVEPHEVASKTQLFTERYMVEWLLQNSLGQIWLDLCAQNGWTPDVQTHGTLDTLEARRADWRQKREAGHVALDALMPIHSEAEERWKYYVPKSATTGTQNDSTTQQQIAPPGGKCREATKGGPTDAKELHLKTLRDLKLLDPACGSGHFLVIAFDLLFALYQEEARHSNQTWSDAQITRWIIEDNLHGIDIDPRAVQIAAAALYLKGRTQVPDFRPRALNLVAPNLSIGNLPDDDPALVELRDAVEREANIPATLVDTILTSLQQAYHLGSLLKLDDTINQALSNFDTQTDLFTNSQQHLSPPGGNVAQRQRGGAREPGTSLEEPSDARIALLDALERFLAHHSTADDLGLRLHGEQLANGIRFVRLNQEGRYDLVVANPPYLGSSKMRNKKYIEKHYPRGKADLYAAFLERGLQLAKSGGLSAMVTMRGWMFIKTYEDIRKHLVGDNTMRLMADLHYGAFNEMKDVSATMAIMHRGKSNDFKSQVVRPVEYEKIVRDLEQPSRNQSGLSAPFMVYEFSAQALEGIEGQPLVYWWDEEFLHQYTQTTKLGERFEVRGGTTTADNTRFLRLCWEIPTTRLYLKKIAEPHSAGWAATCQWVPYIKGGKSRKWLEPVLDVVSWFVFVPRL